MPAPQGRGVIAAEGGNVTPTTELAADVKRRRRLAAAIYLVVFAVLLALVVWRLSSPY